MKIAQHWKNTPEEENKRIIPDKFGYWFAENLPQFFIKVSLLGKYRKPCLKNFLRNIVSITTYYFVMIVELFLR